MSVPENDDPSKPSKSWRRSVEAWWDNHPRWFDSTVTVSAFVIVSPFVLWLFFWRGGGIVVLGASLLYIVYVCPFLLLHLIYFYKASWTISCAINRVALQGLLVGLLLIPLYLVGAPIEKASIERTKKIGEMVAAVLEKYHEEVGYYPVSIAAAEEHFGEKLPLPTVGEKFSYGTYEKGQSYYLSFPCGFMDSWIYDKKKGYWWRD